MRRLDNSNGRSGDQHPGSAHSGWLPLISFSLVVVVAIVALMVTKSPQAVGLSISPLLLPLGWLLGRSGGGPRGGSPG
jgi:hypothetical protein